jgi:hypothetical protein
MIYRLTANRFDSIKKLCQQEGITIEKTEEEKINEWWNVHFVLSDGGHYSIGPRGGLWHYLSPSQREVHPNEWDAEVNNALTDSDFVSEVRERRRNHRSFH